MTRISSCMHQHFLLICYHIFKRWALNWVYVFITIAHISDFLLWTLAINCDIMNSMSIHIYTGFMYKPKPWAMVMFSSEPALRHLCAIQVLWVSTDKFFWISICNPWCKYSVPAVKSLLELYPLHACTFYGLLIVYNLVLHATLYRLVQLSSNPRQPFIIRIKAERHAAAMKVSAFVYECLLMQSAIQQRYQTQPLEFVRVIQNCLLREKELVDQQENAIVSFFSNLLNIFMKLFLYLGSRHTKPNSGYQPRFGMDYMLYRKTRGRLSNATQSSRKICSTVSRIYKNRRCVLHTKPVFFTTQ